MTEQLNNYHHFPQSYKTAVECLCPGLEGGSEPGRGPPSTGKVQRSCLGPALGKGITTLVCLRPGNSQVWGF